MKKIKRIIIGCLLVVGILPMVSSSYATSVETNDNLNIYYPDYTRIDLVCEQMPKCTDKVNHGDRYCFKNQIFKQRESRGQVHDSSTQSIDFPNN